jgi:hypothetical protein
MNNKIYIDLDMDYFVKPVQKSSVNGIRKYKDESCDIEYPYGTINKLKSRVLFPEEKHIFTNHKKSYIYWWMKRIEGCTVIHMDAHSDLYRNKQKDLRLLRDTEMNCDDYLWYAIRDGFINEIYWVYPQGVVNIDDEEIAERIFGTSVINKKEFLENELSVCLDIIDGRGTNKNINIHILEIDSLPFFKEKAIMLTAATSPEFIPEKADILIDHLDSLIGFDQDNIKAVKRQHLNMLNIFDI